MPPTHRLQHLPDHDGGLQLDRRQLLRWLGVGATLPLLASACGEGDVAVDAGPTVDADPSSCAEIPTETAGPYPGDGTNGANALTLAGIVRSDIRTSVGSASGTAAGIPLTVTLTILDVDGCAPLVGAAIYLWHCDRAGDYSMYTGDAATENYLRGVQVTDAAGQVTFTTIFPACYAGRWPHMHFEVYASLAAATDGDNRLAVSQLALPEASCAEVYVTAGYEASVVNLADVSLASDNVFNDGSSQQVATVTGRVAAGYVASLRLAIAA